MTRGVNRNSPPRIAAVRALRVVAGIVGAYAAWILIVNIALWTGLVSYLVSGEHKMSTVRMSHGWAWTIWPTTAHVESFELTIDAYSYQLGLKTGPGVIDLELHELVQRRFHANSIHAQDAVAVFRFKAPEGKVSEQRRALFGPIEGVGEPVRASEPPDIPPEEDAWELELDAIDGQFSELWVNEVRFVEADVRVRGGIRTRSGALFAVHDARVDVSSAVAKMGGEAVAEGWSGALELEVAPYDPFSLKGKAVLGQLSTSGDLAAQVVNLAPAAALTKRSVSLSGGEGPLRLVFSVQEGVVARQTDVDYRTDRVTVGAKGWKGRTGLHATLTGELNGKSALRAGVDLRGAQVWRNEAGDGERITVKHVSAFAASHDTDLTKKLSLDAGHAIVTDADVPTIATFDDLVDAVTLESGSVKASYEVDLKSDGRLAHSIESKLRGVQVRKDETKIGLAADLSASATSSQDLREGKTSALDLDLHDVSLDTAKGHTDRTWVKLHRSSNVSWKGKGEVKATLRGRLDDLRVVLAHRDERQSWVERVPDLNVTKALDFIIDVKRSKGGTEIQVRKLSRPGLRIEGILSRNPKGGNRAAFRLERLGLGLTLREDGEHRIHAATDEAWMDEQRAWVREL